MLLSVFFFSFFLYIVHMFGANTICSWCVGVVWIEKGVITVDSFDKLVQPALTGLGLTCVSVCVCVCVDTCML